MENWNEREGSIHVYEMNEDSNIVIETPVGIKYNITAHEIVYTRRLDEDKKYRFGRKNLNLNIWL